jgi:hypothetical protein
MSEPLEIDVRFEKLGFIVVKTKGPINEETLPSLFRAYAAASKEHGCNRFFLDHRDSDLRLSAMELYRVPENLEEHGIVGHCAALVFGYVRDNERFLETVCVNRGVRARVFSETNAAIKWLTEECCR